MAWLKQGTKPASGVRVVWVCVLSVLAVIVGFAAGYCARHFRVTGILTEGAALSLGSFATHEDATQVARDLSRYKIQCRVVQDTSGEAPAYQVFVYCDSQQQAVRLKTRIIRRTGYGVVVAS